MRCFTLEECKQWQSDHQREKLPGAVANKGERISYPAEAYRFRFFAHWIARSLTYQRPALLWITECDIWPSNVNWHLYYKLRQTYGDFQLLSEAPGHLFLEHESEDLASFLQLAMLFGWEGHLLTQANYVNVFFSHDEFFDFRAAEDANLNEVREVLGKKPAPPL